MVKCRLFDPSVDALVVQAQQTYQRLLAQQGLLNFTRNEMARARSSLRSGGLTRIDPDDVRFQAAILRLRSRKDMPARAMDAAVRELLVAEYECDQSRWERDCFRAAMVEHSRFKLEVHKPPQATRVARWPHTY